MRTERYLNCAHTQIKPIIWSSPAAKKRDIEKIYSTKQVEYEANLYGVQELLFWGKLLGLREKSGEIEQTGLETTFLSRRRQ